MSDVSKQNPYVINTSTLSKSFGQNNSSQRYARASKTDYQSEDSILQYYNARDHGIFSGSYQEWMYQRQYDSGDSSSKTVDHKHASKKASQLEEQLKYDKESNNDHRRASQSRIKENRKNKYEDQNGSSY
jgi:hypothetical protein